MFKAFMSGVALTLAALLLASFALLKSGLIPANADAEPSALETWMARTSLRAC